MSLPIVSADQRLAEKRGVKGVLVGKSGIGKTSQLWTLPPERTLFFDLEAGDLAVEGWAGDTLRPRTWQECRDFAVFIGGANPALRDDQPFSQAHFESVCARFGDPAVLDRYDTVFVDSITVAGRLCLQWCKGQPQAYSEKTGKPDNRGAYGLMGQEMIGWISHLQHTRAKNVWFVGILDERLDDFNRRVFQLQLDGAKTGLELPGIVDEVVTLAELKADDGSPYRAFVCHTVNPWGYPAKDRSGRLAQIEEPHLGRLMAKITGPARPAVERLDFARPTPTEPEQL
jgi:AAA domain